MLGIDDGDDGDISGDHGSNTDTQTSVIPPKHRSRSRLAGK